MRNDHFTRRFVRVVAFGSSLLIAQAHLPRRGRPRCR